MKTNPQPANDTVPKSLKLRDANNKSNHKTATGKRLPDSIQKYPTHSSKK